MHCADGCDEKPVIACSRAAIGDDRGVGAREVKRGRVDPGVECHGGGEAETRGAGDADKTAAVQVERLADLAGGVGDAGGRCRVVGARAIQRVAFAFVPVYEARQAERQVSGGGVAGVNSCAAGQQGHGLRGTTVVPQRCEPGARADQVAGAVADGEGVSGGGSDQIVVAGSQYSEDVGTGDARVAGDDIIPRREICPRAMYSPPPITLVDPLVLIVLPNSVTLAPFK